MPLQYRNVLSWVKKSTGKNKEVKKLWEFYFNKIGFKKVFKYILKKAELNQSAYFSPLQPKNFFKR